MEVVHVAGELKQVGNVNVWVRVKEGTCMLGTWISFQAVLKESLQARPVLISCRERSAAQ